MQGSDPRLQHHYIDNPALGYVSNGSPTCKRLEFGANSTNILTSIKEQAERRNGFSVYCSPSNFTFSSALERFYAWRRWTGAAITLSGAYLEMYSVTGTTTSMVYKRQVGTDGQPLLIHTDASATYPFDYVVSNNFVFFADGNDMKKYDGTTVTNWGITGPSAAVTFSAGSGSLSPTVGYQWQIAWNNSSTGHISSPSTASASTGSGTSRKYTFTGNTTSDSQVDFVRLFRTVDGGSIYYELPASPIAYATWIVSGYEDNTLDSALTTNVSPLPNQNNRPPASKDPVWFANRIWTHLNDTLYYSDFEELVRGVEEESFASTNLRFFGREIFAKNVAGQFLLIFTSDVIYRIYGDSLATFQMDKLSDNRGVLNGAAVTSFTAEVGGQSVGMVAWLDSSNTVWVTDGTSMKEISVPIRPDIASIVHASAALTYHTTGNAQWIILMDGGAHVLRVYDVDMNRWMPPWPIEAITAIYSGATAPGTVKLFLGRNKVPLQQDTGYQDQGVSYSAIMVTNLFDVVEASNPSTYGVIDHAILETGAVTATTLSWLTDEDPATGTYTASQAGISPPNRTQGVNLVEEWFQIRSNSARRASLKITFSATNSNFTVFGISLAYEIVS